MKPYAIKRFPRCDYKLNNSRNLDYYPFAVRIAFEKSELLSRVVSDTVGRFDWDSTPEKIKASIGRGR